MPALDIAPLIARAPLAFPAPTSAASVTSTQAANITPVLEALQNIATQVSSLSSYVSSFEAGGNDIGALIEGNESVVSAITAGSSTVSDGGKLKNPGAHTVLSSYDALITGSAGIRSLLDAVVAGASSFSAEGLQSGVSSDITSQRSAASAFGSVLINSVPAKDKSHASALSASIDSLYNSAMSFF